MKKNKVIYIEDQESSRTLFSDLLSAILGDECEILAPTLEKTKSDMLDKLFYSKELRGASTFIIDEKLCMTGEADYQGSQLADDIRALDEKTPVYILTSYAQDVDALAGSIEFVIDKNDISDITKGQSIAQRILRHINIYKDIRCERSNRFDQLLIKSLNNTLTAEEVDEFNQLNIMRARVILMNEEQPTVESENKDIEQLELLQKIHEKLNQLKGS